MCFQQAAFLPTGLAFMAIAVYTKTARLKMYKTTVYMDKSTVPIPVRR
jgi:hypothetical protein